MPSTHPKPQIDNAMVADMHHTIRGTAASYAMFEKKPAARAHTIASSWGPCVRALRASRRDAPSH